MSRFTLDSATGFLFGSCVHSLSADLAHVWNSSHPKAVNQPQSDSIEKFALAFGQSQHQLALRLRRSALWPLWELWKDETKEDMDVIYDYIDPIIKNALAKKVDMETNKPEVLEMPKTLLDHLVEQTDGRSYLLYTTGGLIV